MTALSPGIRATEALLQSPTVAWPTVLLFFASTATWAASATLAVSGRLSLPAALALSTAAAFAAFTPMHDAAHRSVARPRLVSEVVGRVGGLILTGPFAAFRFVHLEHHKHTNDPALVTAREDEYRATSVFSDAFLTPVFLYQNYHLIHHLYPGIPFYRYARVWWTQRPALLERGASERRLFGRARLEP